MRTALDHLVYAAPTLEHGIATLEALTGVRATPGGQHPGRGTHNALLALGDDTYLEILAPDPTQPAPVAPRWLGVDSVTVPTFTTWAAKATGLAGLRDRAAAHGIVLGPVREGARQRADGVRLTWQLTDPEPLQAGGVIPFLIDWGASPHPARGAAMGVRLVSMRLRHPDAAAVRRMLDVLGIDADVVPAERPGIEVVLAGRHGEVCIPPM